MTGHLPPALVARLDQLHQANVTRFEQTLATPGLYDALTGQGEALFCAETTNTLLEGVATGDSDTQDLATLLAVAIAKLVRLDAEPTSTPKES